MLLLVCSTLLVSVLGQDILFPDDYDIISRLGGDAIEQSLEIDALKKSNELFSADLYRELSKIEHGNFLVCPYCLQIILYLVHAAASSTTSKEIADALHLPDDTSQIQNAALKLSLNTVTPYTLTSVNKVYLAHRFQISTYFKNIVQDTFKADIENVDFKNNEQTASIVNEWVKQKTNNTIKDLISKEFFDANTVSVMINALYFNADWLNAFDSTYTKSMNFFTNKTNKINVNMMENNGYFREYYNETLEAKFLELPYQGKEVAMVVVLPDKIEGIFKLEANIAQVLQEQPLQEASSELLLKLPKFKMETSIRLEPILKNLGIKEAFTKWANFKKMTVGENNVHISHAIQKTFIQVTERGTTAGAGTAIVFMDRMVNILSVNRPFIYIVRHKTNGILFVGKFSNPTGTEME